MLVRSLLPTLNDNATAYQEKRLRISDDRGITEDGNEVDKVEMVGSLRHVTVHFSSEDAEGDGLIINRRLLQVSLEALKNL